MGNAVGKGDFGKNGKDKGKDGFNGNGSSCNRKPNCNVNSYCTSPKTCGLGDSAPIRPDRPMPATWPTALINISMD